MGTHNANYAGPMPPQAVPPSEVPSIFEAGRRPGGARKVHYVKSRSLQAERSTRKVLAGERRIIWHIPRAFSPYSHRLIVAICATFWLFTEQLLFERKTRLKGSFPVVTSYFCMLYLFRLLLWLDVKKRGCEWVDHHQHQGSNGQQLRVGVLKFYNAALVCSLWWNSGLFPMLRGNGEQKGEQKKIKAFRKLDACSPCSP